MQGHESVQPLGQSRGERPVRKRADAEITVRDAKAKPYDETVSPVLMEIRLNETFVGDIDGESPVRALQVLRDDKSARMVSVQRFSGELGGRRGTFVCKARKSSRTARSARHGLSFPDRGQEIFPGCAAKVALKASLQKVPGERWIIGLKLRDRVR